MPETFLACKQPETLENDAGNCFPAHIPVLFNPQFMTIGSVCFTVKLAC